MNQKKFKWSDSLVKEFMEAWNNYNNVYSKYLKTGHILTKNQFMQKFKKLKTEEIFIEKIKYLKA